MPFRALPPLRQRGRCATARARRQVAATISVPETTVSTKLWEGFKLLITSSWDPGWFTSARSVTVWDQLPRGNTWYTWDCAFIAHSGNWVAGTKEVHKMHGSPERVFLAKHPVIWVAWTWEGTKHIVHLGLCLCSAPKNLRGLNLGST